MDISEVKETMEPTAEPEKKTRKSASKASADKAEKKPSSRKTAAEKKPEEKKAATRKTTAKKDVVKEESTETKKPAAAKTTAAKAPAAKTAAAKAEAKKAEPTATVTIQYGANEVVAKKVLTAAIEAYQAAHEDVEVKTVDVYIKPEENAAYYVVNGDDSDGNNRIDLF